MEELSRGTGGRGAHRRKPTAWKGWKWMPPVLVAGEGLRTKECGGGRWWTANRSRRRRWSSWRFTGNGAASFLRCSLLTLPEVANPACHFWQAQFLHCYRTWAMEVRNVPACGMIRMFCHSACVRHVFCGVMPNPGRVSSPVAGNPLFLAQCYGPNRGFEPAHRVHEPPKQIALETPRCDTWEDSLRSERITEGATPGHSPGWNCGECIQRAILTQLRARVGRVTGSFLFAVRAPGSRPSGPDCVSHATLDAGFPPFSMLMSPQKPWRSIVRGVTIPTHHR